MKIRSLPAIPTESYNEKYKTWLINDTICLKIASVNNVQGRASWSSLNHQYALLDATVCLLHLVTQMRKHHLLGIHPYMHPLIWKEADIPLK